MGDAAAEWAFEQPSWDIHVRAEPNGLAWDSARGALFVVDAHGGAVYRITNHGRRRHTSIPLRPGDRLAGIAVTPTGTLYVSRVGNDGGGAVFLIEPDGEPVRLDLPVAPWRLGLVYDQAQHALYTTQFVKPPGEPFAGSLVRIDLTSGTTTAILGGLVKPVGLAMVGRWLVACDASRRTIHRLDLTPRSACRRTQWRIDDRPDSLCAFDAESVLLTTFDQRIHRGSICRMWLDGRVRTIASGPWEPRGVASDGDSAFVSIRRGGRVLVRAID
jgi:sugar lactone lactonase YvrE